MKKILIILILMSFIVLAEEFSKDMFNNPEEFEKYLDNNPKFYQDNPELLKEYLADSGKFSGEFEVSGEIKDFDPKTNLLTSKSGSTYNLSGLEGEFDINVDKKGNVQFKRNGAKEWISIEGKNISANGQTIQGKISSIQGITFEKETNATLTTTNPPILEPEGFVQLKSVGKNSNLIIKPKYGHSVLLPKSISEELLNEGRVSIKKGQSYIKKGDKFVTRSLAISPKTNVQIGEIQDPNEPYIRITSPTDELSDEEITKLRKKNLLLHAKREQEKINEIYYKYLKEGITDETLMDYKGHEVKRDELRKKFTEEFGTPFWGIKDINTKIDSLQLNTEKNVQISGTNGKLKSETTSAWDIDIDAEQGKVTTRLNTAKEQTEQRIEELQSQLGNAKKLAKEQALNSDGNVGRSNSKIDRIEKKLQQEQEKLNKLRQEINIDGDVTINAGGLKVKKEKGKVGIDPRTAWNNPPATKINTNTGTVNTNPDNSGQESTVEYKRHENSKPIQIKRPGKINEGQVRQIASNLAGRKLSSTDAKNYLKSLKTWGQIRSAVDQMAKRTGSSKTYQHMSQTEKEQYVSKILSIGALTMSNHRYEWGSNPYAGSISTDCSDYVGRQYDLLESVTRSRLGFANPSSGRHTTLTQIKIGRQIYATNNPQSLSASQLATILKPGDTINHNPGGIDGERHILLYLGNGLVTDSDVTEYITGDLGASSINRRKLEDGVRITSLQNYASQLRNPSTYGSYVTHISIRRDPRLYGTTYT